MVHPQTTFFLKICVIGCSSGSPPKITTEGVKRIFKKLGNRRKCRMQEYMKRLSAFSFYKIGKFTLDVSTKQEQINTLCPYYLKARRHGVSQ